MRLLLISAALALGVPLHAQNLPCKDLSVRDTKFPVYPAILRAAHVQGVVELKIHLSVDGKADASYLSGPNKGVFQAMVTSAIDYASARQNAWTTAGKHESCDYTLAVEFKILPVQAESPNNFVQVTVINEHYTLLEVMDYKPTVNY